MKYQKKKKMKYQKKKMDIVKRLYFSVFIITETSI